VSGETLEQVASGDAEADPEKQAGYRRRENEPISTTPSHDIKNPMTSGFYASSACILDAA
jgi:hypothetical protein